MANVTPRETNLEYLNVEEVLGADITLEQLNEDLENEENMKDAARKYLSQSQHLTDRRIRKGIHEAKSLYSSLAKN